jgi:hypothetical protein
MTSWTVLEASAPAFTRSAIAFAAPLTETEARAVAVVLVIGAGDLEKILERSLQSGVDVLEQNNPLVGI